MTALFLFIQFKAAATQDDVLAMGDEGIQHAGKPQLYRTFVDDRDDVVIVGDLQIGILIEIIEDRLRREWIENNVSFTLEDDYGKEVEQR